MNESYALSLVQENEAEQWVGEQRPNFLPGVLSFRIKDGNVFPAHMFGENVVKAMTARNWWTIIAKKIEKDPNCKLPKDFCKFFIDLHSCPASSGSIERIFSTFGFVWSDIRNKLSAEKAEKLVKIYRHTR